MRFVGPGKTGCDTFIWEVSAVPVFTALLALFATLSAHPGTYLATGAKGTQVVAVQTALHDAGAAIAEDGIYGPRTASAVTSFQTHHGIRGDGRVDLATAEAMVAAFLPTTVLHQGSTGVTVDALQSLLVMDGSKIAVDGDFGPLTEAAVTHFQKDHDLTIDGVVGPQTWSGLADPEVTVASGDTLATLSAPYGISPLTVAKANGINANLIYPGEVIWFPVFIPGATVTSGGSGSSSGTSTGTSSGSSSSKSSSSSSSASTPPTTKKAAWGGAATPSISLAFYGPPDSVLLAGVAKMGIPVTVFLSAKPTSAVPSAITVGVDALAGSGWRKVASALKSSATPLLALAKAGSAAGPALWSDGLTPVVSGTIASGTSAQAIAQEIVAGAAGGELEAIPLTASGLRAAETAVSELRSEGYVLKSAATLYGF